MLGRHHPSGETAVGQHRLQRGRSAAHWYVGAHAGVGQVGVVSVMKRRAISELSMVDSLSLAFGTLSWARRRLREWFFEPVMGILLGG